MIYMFLSNNPSSGDINSSNLSCLFCHVLLTWYFSHMREAVFINSHIQVSSLTRAAQDLAWMHRFDCTFFGYIFGEFELKRIGWLECAHDERLLVLVWNEL